MGQVLSIPFFIPAAAAPADEPKRERNKKGKMRTKSCGSIWTTIWNLLKVIGIGQETNNASEGMQAEQEEVIGQKTNNAKKGRKRNKKRSLRSKQSKTTMRRHTSTNEEMESEQAKVTAQQTNENDDENTTSTNEEMESEQAKVAKFYAENHNHIVCEHGRDKYTSAMSFIAGKDKFKSVAVPGKEGQIKVTKEVVRRLLIGIFVRFRLLHSEGKTLDGCFTADNIRVPIFKKDEDIFMAPYIEVKLDFLHPDSIKSYTNEGGDKDLMKVGWMLENDIFSSETELPCDLKKLIKLLRSDPIKSKTLIYTHVSLMSPRDQVSHYMWLYKRLMYLKKRVPSSYNNIMQKLKTTDDWRQKAKDNRFLVKLKPTKRYSKDGKGLSRFYRNAVEHLFKLIEDCKTSSASLVEEELEDYHVVYILAEAFPDFLADLQKAFYEEGELETFNNEDST